MSEIVKEAIRAYHRMIDIVEYDQRNRAANLMAPSELVNTEPNPEQVQTPQTKKVCSVPVIEITDTDDDNKDQEVRPIQNRAKTVAVVERKKRQFGQIEENKRENGQEQTSELCHHNVKKKRVDDVNASKSKNNPRRGVRSSKKQKANFHRTIERCDDLEFDSEFDLIETGRLIRGRPYENKDILRMIYTLMRRFSKFEKPNGGSFYSLSRGLYVQVNGDCVQKVSCYGHQKHSCPVLLRIDYKHDDSVYKLYKSGTHNHALNHIEIKKSKKTNIFEDIETEIISSKIEMINMKEENNE